MKFIKIILLLFIIQSLFYSEQNCTAQDLTKLIKQTDSLNNIFRKENLSNLIKAKLFTIIAEKEQKSNKLYEALYYYKQAAILYNNVNRQKEFADVYLKMAGISEKRFDFENALIYYFKAKQVYNEIKDFYNEAHSTEKIAIIYGNKGLEKTGLKYTLLVRKFYQSNPVRYQHELLINSYNLGNIFYVFHKSDSAYLLFKKALTYVNSKTKKDEIAAIYNNIGIIYYDKNKLDTATYYFTKAYSLLQKDKNDFFMGVILVNLGEIKMKEKKYDEGLEYYNKSMKLLLKEKAFDQLISLYLDLKDYYKIKKDFQKSTEYLEKSRILKDSVASLDKLNKFAEIEKLYELKEKENKISLMEKEKELVIKKNKIKTILQYILIVGLFILIIVGILIFRNLRFKIKNKELIERLHIQEKKQFETELELNKKDIENKNKDMEHFALRIVEKNGFIETLEEEINAIQGTEKDKKSLLKIASKIRNNIALENETINVENKINEVYDGFFRKLENKHPALSKTEKRLCTLFMLNIDNKEIASLLNISPEGVKKGRYRLRKKLNLNSNDDITNYLKSL